MTNRTRGSVPTTRRLLVPRLHHEEGDTKIIGMADPEIKWGVFPHPIRRSQCVPFGGPGGVD